ncbi:hypothetical protein GQ43DRAFT_468179 [Delitschia confertaspora ATCC 74209]|uniref:F-box domain-containing protein n=1 Tax=Delitschia confertaspora ATCC 74209 TaxID=1513339 RepID=A0A9P4JVW7_9PLEO|nr:hypothetical protein GQ43DRAFT_468179 [Delitschia confertaspora ATCC 74209]
MKRRYEGDTASSRPTKALRPSGVDHISQLSNELLLKILSYFYTLAEDSQLWKAAYFNRFVRPRVARIPGVSSQNLFYSSKLSKWLEDEPLVRAGQQTNWKRQYKLRHNWSRGKCAVSEIEIAEQPSLPGMLVQMGNGVIFTVDSALGLRAWGPRTKGELIARTALKAPDTDGIPTSLAVNGCHSAGEDPSIAVGFNDGSFQIYALKLEDEAEFVLLYSHPPSNGSLCALAFSYPYLLSMTSGNLLSLYIFPPQDNASSLSSPRLLYTLGSHVVGPESSLAIKPTSTGVTASVAYALQGYLCGWTVGIQEMRFSLSGELTESRMATATDGNFAPVSQEVLTPAGVGWHPLYAKPTSISYTHPYLLVTLPDNTLSLYLVTSTSSLSISPGTRLWGHTSSVSGAHVGGRGKAVSVSRKGNELRVWELEGGLQSAKARKRLLSGEISIRIRPEKSTSAADLEISQIGSGLAFALTQRFDDTSVTPGWIGFDEENVVVLEEKGQGSQMLVVYDFAG